MTLTKRRRLEYQIEHRIADAAAPRLKRGFLEAVRDVQGAVFVPALEAFAGQQNPQAAFDAIPWRELEFGLLDRFQRLIRETVQRATEAQAMRLKVQKQEPPLAPLGFSLDLTNPRAIQWIEQHAAELVVDVSEETKRAVRSQIEQMFRQGIPPREVARRLRSIIGLTNREAQAVENFRRKLELDNAKRIAEQRKPVPQERIDGPVDAYAARLLRGRAERIARTESIRASAEGQQELWTQAQEQGFLDKERTKRAWLVTPDERLCPICAPLASDDALVGLEEPFRLETGDVVMTPPAHPQCRCATGLVFADESGKFTHPQA